MKNWHIYRCLEASVVLGGQSNFTAGEFIAVTTPAKTYQLPASSAHWLEIFHMQKAFYNILNFAFDLCFEMSFSYSVTQ